MLGGLLWLVDELDEEELLLELDDELLLLEDVV